MRISALLLCFCTLCFNLLANAQVYKWTDPQGKVHYGDAPPPQARNIEEKKATANVIETDGEPFETRLAAEKNPVILYSFEDCDSCVMARMMLDKRGIPYTLKNTEQDKIELKKLTGDNIIPVIVVGSQTPRQGFEENAWNSMLDKAGYPKSNPLAGLRKPADKAAPVASSPSLKSD